MTRPSKYHSEISDQQKVNTRVTGAYYPGKEVYTASNKLWKDYLSMHQNFAKSHPKLKVTCNPMPTDNPMYDLYNKWDSQVLPESFGCKEVHPENFEGNCNTVNSTKLNEETKTMNASNSRRIVTIQLIDQDKGLPVDSSIVAVFKDVVTEDTDQVTIQEILMKEDIKGKLEAHNSVRRETTNLDILNRTGNEVKLQPVKLKDLTWVVR